MGQEQRVQSAPLSEAQRVAVITQVLCTPHSTLTLYTGSSELSSLLSSIDLTRSDSAALLHRNAGSSSIAKASCCAYAGKRVHVACVVDTHVISVSNGLHLPR